MTPSAAQSDISIIRDIESWFRTIQPAPSYHDIHLQFSQLIEKNIDLLVCLQEAGETAHARDEIGFSVSVLDFLKRRFSSTPQGIEVDINALDRASVLRALCQQILTAIGIAQALEMNIDGALQDLVACNQSQLDRTGRPVFSLQRKLVPVTDHRVPQYSAYI